jgi:hypothetical protein
MTKATAPLTPRAVLGNRYRALSLNEACAALVALLSGVRVVPPRSDLHKIVKALRHRQARPRTSLQIREARHG